MKNVIILSALVCSFFASAQVGVNTPTPQATFDINAINATGNTDNIDGIIIPRIDRERAQLMATPPISTLIYVNDFTTGMAIGKAIDILAVGFYYFDGTKWTAINTTATNNDWKTTGNTGTTPATNFIGTTDNQNLIFKRNNIDAGVLGTNNTSFGANSLPSSSGALLSAAFGVSSLGNSISGSLGNSAFGYQSLSANTSGTLNSAFGYRALANGTTASRSTAIGDGALLSNSSGIENVAVGHNSLDALTAGGNNVALGTDALGNLTSGIGNTAIGDNTGLDVIGGTTLTTGNNNILIGRQASLPNGDNQISIGNIIFGNNITGTVASPAGNIGIAVSSPQKRLDVDAGSDVVRLRNLQEINNTNSDGTIRSLTYNTTTGDVSHRISKQVQSVTLNNSESATLTDATGGVNGTLLIRTAVNSTSAGSNMTATFNYARRGLGLLGIAIDSATEPTFTRSGAGAGVTYTVTASPTISFTITKPTANTITITNTSGASRGFTISTEALN